MHFYGITDIGKVRKENEDVIFCPKEDSNENLFILADGMGGANAGEVASKIAIDSSKKYFIDNIALAKEKEEIQDIIKKSILNANEDVINSSEKNTDYKGMGTTLIMAYANKNKLYIGHVGDSRVYRIRKNIIRQLTKDHSFVQELVRNGSITSAEAAVHPQKNILTKVIGYESDMEPDIITKGFLKDDIILICSDGLTNMVSDKELYEIIVKNTSNVEVMCKELINAANDAGGTDNISAIVISND